MRHIYIFFFFLFSLLSCSQAQVGRDFYLGLKSNNNASAVSHFERGLSSNNIFVRQASAQELAALMAGGVVLSNRTETRMRREISGAWAQALNSLNDKNSILAFLLNMDQSVPGEARQYVLRESASLLNEHESAAVNGHYAIFNLRYNEALASFRGFQEDGEWPEYLPEIFIKYPVLINDLGRAFQFTASGSEGIDVLLNWERNLPKVSSLDLTEIRFRLQFFAARISRRIGRDAFAKDLFEQSLLIAPNAEQTDACIWYILDLSFRENTEIFIQSLEQYVSHWNNKNYFNTILERFLQILAFGHDWDTIANVFNIIKDSGAAIKSAYAWVLVRVIDEGFSTQVELAGRHIYLNAAYNTGGNDLSSTLYYRGLSAVALGKPFLSGLIIDTTEAARRSSGRQATAAMQFVNGFFDHYAEDHALRYILQLENELSIEDLRAAAGALEQAGMYVQVIRLVIRYSNREDYAGFTRRDLELLFPNPYKDLVEKYAEKFDIAPEILFGLIRTESAFQPAVVSHAGAVGLTQLIPATAEEMAGRIRRAGGHDYTGENLNLDDPEQNIHIGMFYLNYLLGRFEDNILLALLSYNGGMNRIRRLRNTSTLPYDLFMETINISETRDYGRKVLGAAEVYRALYY